MDRIIKERDLREIYGRMYDKLRSIQIGDKFDYIITDCRRRTYKGRSDDYFSEMLSAIVFDAGGWSWNKDKAREAFSNYKVNKVAGYDLSDDNVEKLKARTAGISRDKIRAAIRNARKMLERIKEYGAFWRYLDRHMIKEGIWNLPTPHLVKDLVDNFGWINWINAHGFLKYIGFDTMKPDRHARRILYRLKLTDSDKDTRKTRDQVQEAGKMMVDAVGERINVIDEMIYIYGSGDKRYVKEAICGDKPLCGECNLTEFCEWQSS